MLRGIAWLLGALWLNVAAAAPLIPPSVDKPAVSIIIDDMGTRLAAGLRVVNLPGPVACSFLPRAPHTHYLALAAHSRNKEVMLHLPMQPIAHRPLDPGGLTLDMTQHQLVQTLQRDLALVPHVTGVNNHMGSLLTQHPGHMLWLMRALKHDGPLFFVDSRTTARTVALQVARENHVPSVKRDVFLDDDRHPDAIRAQFMRLVGIAEKRGNAVAIGHPYPETLAVLEQMIPQLADRGIRLVPLSTLIPREEPRSETWQASLSPSPQAARNSKP